MEASSRANNGAYLKKCQYLRQLWLNLTIAFTSKIIKQAATDLILEMSLKTTYQLSIGQRRSVYVDGSLELNNAFYELTDFDGGKLGDHIRLAAESRHRIIFINKNALDYVSIPTYRYEEGRIEAAAEDLDA